MPDQLCNTPVTDLKPLPASRRLPELQSTLLTDRQGRGTSSATAAGLRLRVSLGSFGSFSEPPSSCVVAMSC